MNNNRGFMAGQYTYLRDMNICPYEKAAGKYVLTADPYITEGTPFQFRKLGEQYTTLISGALRLYIKDFWITVGPDQETLTPEGEMTVKELEEGMELYSYADKGQLTTVELREVEKMKVLVKLYTVKHLGSPGLFINSVYFNIT